MLYVCDFPPANKGGGDTLLMRLLEGYPADSLLLAVSHRRADDIPQGPFHACEYLGLHEFTGRKRHGMAQLLLLLDRLLIPFHALRLAWYARKWKPEIILTVAHGYLFLAAHLCAVLCRLPVVMIVHDDWAELERYVRLFRPLLKPLFRWSLRRSAHLYAVSEAMVEHLKKTYGVNATLQLPATFPSDPPPEPRPPRSPSEPVRILYAGMIYNTVFESLDLLAKTLLRRSNNNSDPQPAVQLHIYSPLSQDELDKFGWTSPVVQAKGWVDPRTLRPVLEAADILFLPISFANGGGCYASTSFPSKVADYLAAGRPILVLAPESAAAAQYLQRHGCAIVLSALQEGPLGEAIQRFLLDATYVADLSRRSLQLFHQRHNIEIQRADFHHTLKQVVRPCRRIP